jgi:transcription elongation factor GreA
MDLVVLCEPKENSNQVMPTDISLQQAVQAFALKLAPSKHLDSQEALRFARWYGEARPISGLTPVDIQHYTESSGLHSSLAEARAASLKAFLAFADKEGMTSSRLVSHVRVRRASRSKGIAPKTSKDNPEVRMTAQGHAAAQADLDQMISERPRVAEELRQARSDGDVSENAPLDAARESQGKLEGRIRDLEAKLRLAVIVENDDSAASADVAHIGSKVVISDLATGTKREYQIVNASEAHGAGRLAHDSPVGRAIIGHRVGEVIKVSAPRGLVEYRLESVQA